MVASPSPGARRVPVGVGPTASGKTEVSLLLAGILGGEIVSADSRQIFKYLDIGTAKPTVAQRASVPHHFVDELLPDQDFSAGQFGERGRRLIDDILGRRRVPIVVGGSGLYIQSLIDGFFDGPGADPEIREALNARLKADGILPLLDELRRVDPVSAGRIDPTKPRRIIRALEVFHISGRPLSSQQDERRRVLTFTPVMFGLSWERQELYDRINRRCGRMVEEGLVHEALELERQGFHSSLNALNTVGYREAYSHVRGEIDREEMLRIFRRNSRRYAKRQTTWFRRDSRITWIPMSDERTSGDVAEHIGRMFSAQLQRIPPLAI